MNVYVSANVVNVTVIVTAPSATMTQQQHSFVSATTTAAAAASGGVSKWVAVMACIAMAVFYVAILYAPTVILRLPRPTSFKSYMIRRFVCAAVSSAVSLLASSLLLPVSWEAPLLLSAFGIRLNHVWQAVVYPLLLTSLMYAGSLLLKCMLLIDAMEEYWGHGQNLSMIDLIKFGIRECINWMFSLASNVGAWRNYFVAPLTEELVFRACMIPLLLCGGFSTYAVVFLSPISFSLAHLNHLLELYTQQTFSLLRALKIIGLQLGYTVIFGSYASFLFVRTGHLVSPLIAHVFCNYMGLPVIFSHRTGMITVASIAGTLGFFCLLFPLTRPQLYNYGTDNCKCWHRYCRWS